MVDSYATLFFLTRATTFMKAMKHIVTCFCVLLLINSHSAMAQASYLTISGQTVDSETRETLPYAMLRLKSKPIGTVSNQIGEFDFHIPPGYHQDTILISMLGYHDYEIPIQEVMDKTNFIALMQVRPILLEEVTVRPSSLSARQIIAEAIHRIPINYPQDPFILHGFFRDSKKDDTTYVSLLEAAIRIYDRNYDRAPKRQRRLLERVTIDEIRRSYNYTNRRGWQQRLNEENSLKELLGNNLLRYQYGPFNLENDYEYRYEEDVFYHDKRLFVITMPEFPGTEIYIDSESYAIVRFKFDEENLDEESIDENTKRIAANTSTYVEYEEFDNKYYLKYFRTFTTYQDIDLSTNAIINVSKLHLELLINEVQTEEVRRFNGERTMNKFKNLDSQIRAYNKSFWDAYNVIKETPIDSQMIEDLERYLPLEEQFIKQEGKH